MAPARGLLVTNRTFKKTLCPGHLAVQRPSHKNQTDYIFVKQKWHSSVLDVTTTRHNTVLDSEHKMLLAKIRFKLKAHTKKVRQSDLDTCSLQIPAVLDGYRDSLYSLLQTLLDDLNIDMAWSSILNAMSAAATRSLPKKGPAHKPWISPKSLALIARRAKCRSKELMKIARKAVKRSDRADKVTYVFRLADEDPAAD